MIYVAYYLYPVLIVSHASRQAVFDPRPGPRQAICCCPPPCQVTSVFPRLVKRLASSRSPCLAISSFRQTIGVFPLLLSGDDFLSSSDWRLPPPLVKQLAFSHPFRRAKIVFIPSSSGGYRVPSLLVKRFSSSPSSLHPLLVGRLSSSPASRQAILVFPFLSSGDSRFSLSRHAINVFPLFSLNDYRLPSPLVGRLAPSLATIFYISFCKVLHLGFKFHYTTILGARFFSLFCLVLHVRCDSHYATIMAFLVLFYFAGFCISCCDFHYTTIPSSRTPRQAIIVFPVLPSGDNRLPLLLVGRLSSSPSSRQAIIVFPFFSSSDYRLPPFLVGKFAFPGFLVKRISSPPCRQAIRVFPVSSLSD